MIKMLKQFKNTSKNLPKAVFTQETENVTLTWFSVPEGRPCSMLSEDSIFFE